MNVFAKIFQKGLKTGGNINFVENCIGHLSKHSMEGIHFTIASKLQEVHMELIFKGTDSFREMCHIKCQKERGFSAKVPSLRTGIFLSSRSGSKLGHIAANVLSGFPNNTLTNLSVSHMHTSYSTVTTPLCSVLCLLSLGESRNCSNKTESPFPALWCYLQCH